MEGDLEHVKWKNFAGCMELEGTVGTFAADWLKSTGWVPASVFPRVPFSLNPLRICTDSNGIKLMGKIEPAGDETIAFSTDRIDYLKVKQNPEGSEPSGSARYPVTHVSGTLTRPSSGSLLATISSANLCGMDMAATWALPSGPVRVTLNAGRGSETTFETILSCLGLDASRIKGNVILDGVVEGDIESLSNGHFVISSQDGTIQGMTMMTRILNVLNVTGLFSKSSYQSFFSGGFHYKELSFRGRIENNVMVLESSYIYGDGMNLFFNGTIDLGTRMVNIVVLAAPLKGIDALLRYLPFLDSDTGILTIPVSVRGHLVSPDVVILGPGKLTDRAVNVFKSVFRLPFRMLDILCRKVIPAG